MARDSVGDNERGDGGVVIRDIMLLAGFLIVVVTTATQSLWIAGLLVGCGLIVGSLWWSYAVGRAEQKAKQNKGP